MDKIKKTEDKGNILAFLTDSILILIGIMGSIFYTSLVGIMAIFGLFILESRRMKKRKEVRPLIVYPAIKFSWIIALAFVGVLAFVFGGAYEYGFSMAVGYLVLIVWWLISFRVYRYNKARKSFKKVKNKPKVIVKKRTVIKKKSVKKTLKKKSVKKAVKKKPVKKKFAKKKSVKKKKR